MRAAGAARTASDDRVTRPTGDHAVPCYHRALRGIWVIALLACVLGAAAAPPPAHVAERASQLEAAVPTLASSSTHVVTGHVARRIRGFDGHVRLDHLLAPSAFDLAPPRTYIVVSVARLATLALAVHADTRWSRGPPHA